MANQDKTEQMNINHRVNEFSSRPTVGAAVIHTLFFSANTANVACPLLLRVLPPVVNTLKTPSYGPTVYKPPTQEASWDAAQINRRWPLSALSAINQRVPNSRSEAHL